MKMDVEIKIEGKGEREGEMEGERAQCTLSTNYNLTAVTAALVKYQVTAESFFAATQESSLY